MKLSTLFAISLLPLPHWQKLSLAHSGIETEEVLRRFSVPNGKRRLEDLLRLVSTQTYSAIFYKMPCYPKALLELDNPPFRLLVKGTLPQSDGLLFTLCGTRHPSFDATLCSYQLAANAARNGITLVTSNSQGIDRSAVKAYVDGRVPPLVVCDCGLVHTRITTNPLLSNSILLSAYEPYADPLRTFCLSRNILSTALGEVTVVVQAPRNSGSLHCACAALDFGREVFVHGVGNRGGIVNEGSRTLVEEGSMVIHGYDDLAKQLGWPPFGF